MSWKKGGKDENFLRNVLETLPIGVWIIDKKGKILHGNPAGQQIWGGAKYVGIDQYGTYKGWWPSTGKQIEADEWGAARAIRKGETSTNEEIEIECFDGTRKIVLHSAVPILNNQQEVEGAIVVIQDITDRKKDEEKYRNLTEHIPGMVYRGRPDWSAEIITNSELICGYSTQDFNSGRIKWSDIIHPDDRKTAFEESSKLKQKKISIVSEYRIFCRNKEVRWVADHKQSFFNSNGEFAGVDGIVFDITEHKRAEGRYKTILGTAMDGFWLMNLQGRFLDVNDAYCRTTGYSRDEILKMAISDIEVIESPEETAKHIQKVITIGNDLFETRHRCKDGRILDVEVSTNYIAEEEGLLFVFLRDITSRKETERIIKIRNQIADVFLTKSNEEMYADVLDIILKVTKSEYGIFGYIDENESFVCPSMTRDIWTKCQVPDKAIVFPRDKWGGIWGHSIIEKKTLYSNEPRHVPEGHFPIERILVVPIMYRGEVIGLFEVANKPGDYTEGDIRLLETIAGYVAPVLIARLQREREERERKKAEAGLRKAKDELEEKNKELRELDQIKSQFVANVSHEFRSPLSTVKESIEIVLDGIAGGLNPKQRHLLETGNRTIKRLARLTTDLLDITRIEAGRVQIKRQKIDFSELIDEVVSTYEIEMSKKKIAYRKIEAKPVGSIWGDRDMISEVIINLLNNAIKYTPEEGRIEIKIAGDKKEVRFDITDTGHGIPEDVWEKMFNKFERILTEKADGTGLGLPIAKDIVELHKGKIWVESQPGKGSTFTFVIPRDLRTHI